MIADAVGDTERTRIFSRYSLIGALAGALGSLAAATPDFLRELGFTQIAAIRWMFVLYALLGLLGALIYAGIRARASGPGQTVRAPLGPSRNMVYKLAALFSLDAFAGGFVVQSLLALWLFGGLVIRSFVSALFLGILIGTHSSYFVSTPSLYYLKLRPGADDGAEGAEAKLA